MSMVITRFFLSTTEGIIQSLLCVCEQNNSENCGRVDFELFYPRGGPRWPLWGIVGGSAQNLIDLFQDRSLSTNKIFLKSVQNL